MIRARFKALVLLDPSVLAVFLDQSVLADFWGNPQKFRDSGSTEQNSNDEPKVMKEKGDTKVSAAILGRHLTVYKSHVVLNKFSMNRQRGAGEQPGILTINHTSLVFIKKKTTQR